jgi:spore germination protein
MQHRRTAALALAALLSASASSAGAQVSRPQPPAPSFAEVWAYVMDGEEKFLDPSYPITDLCYFGAGLSSQGKLIGVPDRGRLGRFQGRAHLVVSEIGNYALTHFCLDPAFPLRDELIADIARAAEKFDGVQIDFEAVLSKDYDAFLDFVSALRQKLGGKALSIALPARMSEKSDAFGYERVSKVADRVVVMAYDEHWSTSAPGPVASIEWCSKVSDYARSKIPVEKLVMGNPFYGRAWADKSLSRAYKYSGLSAIITEKGIDKVERQGTVPYFEYSETVTVRAYFDDAASILARLGMYFARSIANVAFWRLGQEDPSIWKAIAISATAPVGAQAQSGPPAMAEGGGGDPEIGIE